MEIQVLPSVLGHGRIKMSQSNKFFWQHALTTKLPPGSSSMDTRGVPPSSAPRCLQGSTVAVG